MVRYLLHTYTFLGHHASGMRVQLMVRYVLCNIFMVHYVFGNTYVMF